MRGISMVVLPFAEEVPQHGFGFGAHFFGHRACRRTEKAADIEAWVCGKRYRRRQLRKERKGDETASPKEKEILTPAQPTPPTMSDFSMIGSTRVNEMIWRLSGRTGEILL